MDPDPVVGPAAPGESVPPAAERSRAASPAGVTFRDLLLGGVGLVVTAAVTLAMLNARPASPSAAVADASETVVSEEERAETTPASAAPVEPLWSSASRATWLGNARRGVAFDITADNLIGVWMRTVRPTLVVRCVQGRVDVFVMTESAAALEPQTDDHTVTLRFDHETETTERWPDSTEHDALFAPDGAAFAQRLMQATTLEFGFTPHNAAPAVARFRVSGLERLLMPAVRECGWKK